MLNKLYKGFFFITPNSTTVMKPPIDTINVVLVGFSTQGNKNSYIGCDSGDWYTCPLVELHKYTGEK